MDAIQATTQALLQVIDRLLVADAVGLFLFTTIIYVLVYALVRALGSNSSSGAGIPSQPSQPPVTVPVGQPAQPPANPTTDSHPDISMGAVGAAVNELQGLLGVAVDGEFGSDTDTAVRSYQATHGLDVDGEVGTATWAALLANKPAVVTSTGVALSADTINSIVQAAGSSALAHYAWSGRGTAPAGYIKGMAVAYANVYAKWKQKSSTAAALMASANSGDSSKDALAWYAARFSSLGMGNTNAGPDTLRHVFVLLTGLGMRESSGRYCCGRDTSTSNTTADTAEAGLFQQSWNSNIASPEMPKLFAQYTANPQGFLSVFAEGVTATSEDLENYGSGDGAAFQKLCKSCPAFAVEMAAVGLRTIRQHWGPINRQEAEIRPEADQLFNQVQAIVDADVVVAPAVVPAVVPATPAAPVVVGGDPPWIILGRTYNGLTWHKGQAMPLTIAAWIDAIAVKFPDMQAYCTGLKNAGKIDWWPWCGLFVQSMLAPSGIRGPISAAGLAGQETTSDWAYAKAWAVWGTDASDNPQRGDVLVWSFGHVSFYDHPEPTTNDYASLGGDQGTPLRVCIEDIAMDSCIAIRRPPVPA